MNKGSLYYIVQPTDTKFSYPPCVGIIQPIIRYRKQDIGKYVISIVNYTEFFLTPDSSVWCNGLDGKTNLSDCIALFNNEVAALDAIRNKRYFNKEERARKPTNAPDFRIFVVSIDNGGNICFQAI